MKGDQIFAIFTTTLLLIHSGSAGLLQSIRDAAFLKDSLTQDAPREHRSLSGRGLELPEFSNIPSSAEEPSFFDRYSASTPKPTTATTTSQATPCPPGDFLCLAKRSMKHTLGSEMSNAIITSVASLMTEMLNTTISRSLDIVHQSQQSSHDAQKEADARAAVNMMTNTISTVSTKVIQGLASFIKVSLSGAMWDMFNQVMRAASGVSGGVGSVRGLGKGQGQGQGRQTTRTKTQQLDGTEQKMVSLDSTDPALGTPISDVYQIPIQNGNEIRRSSGNSDGGVVGRAVKLTAE